MQVMWPLAFVGLTLSNVGCRDYVNVMLNKSLSIDIQRNRIGQSKNNRDKDEAR